MLLRRFTEHVRDQNWLAVALDFFIVVGGVLLAFQLQSWGERRAVEQRAERSLHQLYQESEEALEYWVDEVRLENGRLLLQDRVLRALSAGERGDLTDDQLEEALAGIGRYPTLSPPRRSYDELAGAGLLRDINAPDAMAAVADYYVGVDFIQGQINFFRPDGGTPDDILTYSLTSRYDPTRSARQRIEVDFGALAADDMYVQTAVGEYRNQMVFQFYRRGAMHRAAEMCIALADAVGESCAGLDFYSEWRELPEWQMREVPNYGERDEEQTDENESED